MADRKPFLLRIDATVLEALQRWAADDLRSLNGQIEFVLRRALQASGRLPKAAGRTDAPPREDAGTADDSKAPGELP